MVNYYGKFIPRLAHKRRVLSKLTGNVPYRWGAQEQRAFEELKEALVSAPVLRDPDWSRPFILHTDWSADGIGVVLAQEDDDGNEYVVEYHSRACTAAESAYPSYKGEMLALVWGARRCRYTL